MTLTRCAYLHEAKVVVHGATRRRGRSALRWRAAIDVAAPERWRCLHNARAEVTGASGAERRVVLAGAAAVLEVGSNAHHCTAFN